MQVDAHSGATDVLFEDEDVCVLRPDSPRGLVVFHKYLERFHDQITREGLVLGSGLRTGTRSINHPFIFFRAPSRNSATGHNPRRPTLLDISCNYEPCQIDLANPFLFCIRIDPARTAVYSSEARVNYWGTDLWRGSRVPMQTYWDILDSNKSSRTGSFYNVLTYERCQYPSEGTTIAPPERNAEILVRSSIPPEWRVNFQQ